MGIGKNKDSAERVERDKAIKEAKEICCEITECKDFAFISKVHLALVVRNLVIDFHKKNKMLNTSMNRVEELTKKYEPKKQEEEKEEGGQR